MFRRKTKSIICIYRYTAQYNLSNFFFEYYKNVIYDFFSKQNHIGKLTVHISNKTSFAEFINSLEAATIINENASFKW